MPRLIRFWWLALLFITGLRVAAAALAPLQGAEAYYWTWSLHLDWGYYDHPPLIAWAIRATTALLGATPLAVRLPSLVGGTVATLGVWALARAMAGDRAAAQAGLAALAVPFLSMYTILAFPDGLLLGACAVSTLLVWRGRWLGGGVALGLGLLAKFHAVLVGAATLVYAATCLIAPLRVMRGSDRPEVGAGRTLTDEALGAQARGRHGGETSVPIPPPVSLRALGAWAAAACVLTAPFLAWNARNHWATFGFQLVTRHETMHFHPLDPLRFFVEQAAVVSPILWGCLIAALVMLWRQGSESGRFLALHAVFPIAPFALYAFWHPARPHWPLVGYLPALAGLGVAIEGLQSARLRRWSTAGIALGTALTLVLLAVPLRPGLLFAFAGHPDGASATEQYSFVELGRQVRDRAGNAFVLTQDNRLGSAIQFYSGLPVHWYSYTVRGREMLRWENYPALRGRDGLFVETQFAGWHRPIRWLLEQAFEEVSEPEVLPIAYQGRVARTYELWRCRRFRGHGPDYSLTPPPG